MQKKRWGNAFEGPVNLVHKHQAVVTMNDAYLLVACDHVVEQCQNRWPRIN